MTHRTRELTIIAGLIGALGLAACGDDNQPDQGYNPTITPGDFVSAIDNPYFPLRPGTVFRFSGTLEGASQTGELTITLDTKSILGVKTVVVRDRVLQDGALAEETFDWYAQDTAGNVWYFGEDAKEYKDGKVVATKGSWEAGKDGAKPGLVMKATPQVGDTYRQEYAQGVAEDMARVLSVDESLATRLGSFTRCLRTEDWSALEPDVREEKTFCPEVGQVLGITVKGGNERMELVEIAKP